MTTAKLTNNQQSYLNAKAAYYTGAPTMTDAAFDKLEAMLRVSHPNWAPLKEVRTPGKKHDVKFAVAMPSLHKVYTDEKRLAARVEKMRAEDPVLCVMPKYDGSSVLLTYRGGALVEAVTGGNSTVGKSIKHLIPAFRNVPLKITEEGTVHLRCEAIIPIKHHAKLKGPARAIVAGALNRIEPDTEVFNLIHFVVLRVFANFQRMTSGLRWARQLGFEVSRCSVPKHPLTPEFFSFELQELRDSFEYETDGIVLVADTSACLEVPGEDNPKFMFAIKENASERFDAKVVQIVWQASRHGILTPKAQIEPVTFASGHTVTYATLHNAKWAKDRRIGPGAVVTILRSGEVIPKIVAVPTPGTFQKPDAEVHGEWNWDECDIRLKEQNEEGKVREYLHALKLIGMKSVGSAAVEEYLSRKLTHSADEFIRNLLERPDSTLRSCGFKDDTATKMAGTVPQGMSLATVMNLSGCFAEGFGVRRAQKVERFVMDKTYAIDAYQEKLGDVFGHHGFNGAAKFRRWYTGKNHAVFSRAVLVFEKEQEEAPSKAPVSQHLKGHVVSFTGYRDTEHEAWVVDNGGVVKDFSSKTTILLVKEGGKKSSKVDKAKAAGVLVIDFSQLKTGAPAIPAYTNKEIK